MLPGQRYFLSMIDASSVKETFAIPYFAEKSDANFLNSRFALDPGTIYITDFRSENQYLHFYEEIADDVYMSYQSEGDRLTLSSHSPDSLAGGFVVMIPAALASDGNLAEIRRWVEYYRYAGTTYKISTYE